MDATETLGDGRGPSHAVAESLALRICARPGRAAANLFLLPEFLKTCIPLPWHGMAYPTASQISWRSGIRLWMA